MGLTGTVRRRGKGRYGAVVVTALFIVQTHVGTMPGWAAEDEAAEAAEREAAMKAYLAFEENKRAAETMQMSEGQDLLLKELKALEKELLQFPKKDRFHFGQDTHYTYDSNPNRARIHVTDKGDSTFRMNPFVEVNLGGQKTDLSLEYRWNRIYNVKRPASDNFTQEANLRFGRKILPKTTLSLNDRLGRTSSRVAGRDNKKIGWDNSHRVTLNYDLNPKIALNLESNYTRSDYPAEADDEASNYSYSLDPNFSIQLTPKTKFTMGYRWSFTRIPTESSDATTHEVRMGYSGRLTPKSTLSADISYNSQDPDSAQVGRSDSLNTSLGYVWQATSKTSLRAMYSNSFAHSISDSVSGAALLKSTSRTASDTWTLSIHVRLHRKLTAEFSFNPSHSHSKTRQTGVDNTRSRTFTFPFQLAMDINLLKWLKMRLTYTYRHQIGNEHKTNEHRAHTWFVGLNSAF